MKALITSGCSLSETTTNKALLKTWPAILAEVKSFEYVDHRGMGSIGTDFIAKRAIHAAQQALTKYDGKDILVVCAYSTLWRTAGIFNHRDDVFAQKMLTIREQQLKECSNNLTWLQQGCSYDTTSVLNQNDSTGWYFWNLWRETDQCQYYYTLYQTSKNMLEQYLWNMYAVENFCKANNINYVWMQVDNQFKESSNELEHWTLKHLYQSVINTKHHLNTPIAPWVTEHYPDKMSDELHPITDGHEHYVNEVLIPFLEKHGYC